MSVQSTAWSLPAGPQRPKAHDPLSALPTCPPPLARMLIDVRDLSRPSEIAFAPVRASAGALGRVAQAAGGAAAQIARALLEWQQRVRERRQLKSMDDRMLRDIGLSRNDVRRL